MPQNSAAMISSAMTEVEKVRIPEAIIYDFRMRVADFFGAPRAIQQANL